MSQLRALVLFLGLAACGTSGVCPKATGLVSTDGGEQRCVASVDCPRESNVLVCTNTSDRYRDCVDCVDSKCVRFRPGACP